MLLTNRLKICIGSYIHWDQSGFVLGRYLKSNTHRLLNLIYLAGRQEEPMVIYSLDAENVFDRLE